MLRHFLIIYCSKKASKYNDLLSMYKEDVDGLNHIYTTGLMVVRKEKWLGLVQKLQPKR